MLDALFLGSYSWLVSYELKRKQRNAKASAVGKPMADGTATSRGTPKGERANSKAGGYRRDASATAHEGGGPIYVSAKRTHRFCLGKQHLSVRATIGYTIKGRRKTVGSFSKTNPPGEGFEGVEQGNWVVLSAKWEAARRQSGVTTTTGQRGPEGFGVKDRRTTEDARMGNWIGLVGGLRVL